MDDTPHLALIHAEIDGELDARQRAELARQLLAEPQIRTEREDLRQLCAALDALPEVEPPAQLRASILAALPPSGIPRSRSGWSAPRWRYAALLAGVLGAGALVFETLDGTRPATTEAAGTMAAARVPVTLDTVRLNSGPVAGRVSLYRDSGGLGVVFALVAPAPVDVLITSGEHTLRINALGRTTGPGEPTTTVALRGFGTGTQAVTVTFLMDGRQVGSATLRSPDSR
jgi:anti-sigma factor RsiW